MYRLERYSVDGSMYLFSSNKDTKFTIHFLSEVQSLSSTLYGWFNGMFALYSKKEPCEEESKSTDSAGTETSSGITIKPTMALKMIHFEKTI
mgnify:CR=1 FL=1